MSGKIRATGFSGSGKVTNVLEAVGNFYGLIQAFGGGVAAAGTEWLAADGTSLARTDYPSLFAAIGTTWGSADGNSFNVPDLRACYLRQHGAATAQMGNTNVYNGGNLGTMSNDAEQDSRSSIAGTGLLKVGGPQYQSGFTGRTIGTHGMAYRTGVFYYDHTQGGSSPYASQFAAINTALASPGGTGATDGGTMRVGGEVRPFSASVEYCIFAGEKYS